MEKFRKLLIDNGIIAVVVFVATFTGNLWFEKQKTIDTIKLNDSNIIATRANELWDQISKLESEYSRLEDLRSLQNISIMFDKPDKELQKKIDSKAGEMYGKHDEVSHIISESSHVIGKPLSMHMARYMYQLRSYYNSKESLRRAHQLSRGEDLSFMEKEVEDSGALLYQMKMDFASTREYALQQTNR